MTLGLEAKRERGRHLWVWSVAVLIVSYIALLGCECLLASVLATYQQRQHFKMVALIQAVPVVAIVIMLWLAERRHRAGLDRTDDPIGDGTSKIEHQRGRLIGMPSRSATRALGAAIVMVFVLGLGALILWPSQANGLSACRVLSNAAVERAVGIIHGPARADVPESGGPPGATVCNYGRTPGPTLTVFAAKRDGAKFFRAQHQFALARGAPHDLSQPGYQAFGFTGPDPTGALQTFFLLKHGQYINVVIWNAPAGAADRLSSVVANAIP